MHRVHAQADTGRLAMLTAGEQITYQEISCRDLRRINRTCPARTLMTAPSSLMNVTLLLATPTANLVIKQCCQLQISVKRSQVGMTPTRPDPV
jgi:hypothetical protein